MSDGIVFDLSRLALRFTRPAPNGIDRVDLAFARHFVSESSRNLSVILTVIGPRTVPPRAARVLVDALETQWQETSSADDDPVFWRVRNRILHDKHSFGRIRPYKQTKRTSRSALEIAWRSPLIGRQGLFPGGSPSRTIPAGATYINVSQFPFSIPGAWRWLERRPDIKAVFLVHDMLPLTHPEFFPPQEYKQHRNVVDTVCRLGHLIIVPSEHTRHDLAAHCRREGLSMPRAEVVPLPVDDNFRTKPVIEAALASQSYFVACGTIEPRKNHLLLLNVWRELAMELGQDCPKLILVGGRGWHNANVIDMLERCEPIAPHVVEVSGLSTPGLKRLLDNSRGLLMPSFAEGFGLPVAEACAAGVPVLASEIPVFDQFRDGPLNLIDPVNGVGWLNAVRKHASKSSTEMPSRLSARCIRTSDSFFATIQELIEQPNQKRI
jgi:glycosyltransferase involved in cell wall biosynthesis